MLLGLFGAALPTAKILLMIGIASNTEDATNKIPIAKYYFRPKILCRSLRKLSSTSAFYSNAFDVDEDQRPIDSSSAYPSRLYEAPIWMDIRLLMRLYAPGLDSSEAMVDFTPSGIRGKGRHEVLTWRVFCNKKQAQWTSFL